MTSKTKETKETSTTAHQATAVTAGATGTDPAHERVLSICRVNWALRGIDDASVREMLDELSAHLEDAAAAGRTAEDIVGPDVRAFAASWARARSPLHRRALRTAAFASTVCGGAVLVSFLLNWTTQLKISADHLAFFLVIAVLTTAWEMRRGTMGIARRWSMAAVVALAVSGITLIVGEKVLFTTPLWAVPLLFLPSLPFAWADRQARRRLTC